MIDKLHNWDDLTLNSKATILEIFLDNAVNYENLVDYFENYTVKMLQHIANYYEIPKRRLKKEELIELIIQFENESENSLNVYNRKRCWHYIHELQNDTYFGKFISFH